MKRIYLSVFLVLLLLIPAMAQAQRIEAGRIYAGGSTCSTGVCVSANVSNEGSASIQISETYSGTLEFEGTTDNANWFSIYGATPSGATAYQTTSTGQWQFTVSALASIRVRCSSYTSGKAEIAIKLSSAAYNFPTSATIAGSVDVDPITGQAGVAGGAGATGANTLRTTDASDSPNIPLLTAIKDAVDDVEGDLDSIQAQLPSTLAGDGGLPVSAATADAAYGAAMTNNPVPVTFPLASTPANAGTPYVGADHDQYVSVRSSASGGASLYSFISTSSANLTNVKASAGVIKTIMITNPTANKQYFKLYNKASAPDPSNCSSNSDCGVLYQIVPANSTDGGGFVLPLPPEGVQFDTGIGYSLTGAACTVLASCTDETSSDAGVAITIIYK